VFPDQHSVKKGAGYYGEARTRYSKVLGNVSVIVSDKIAEANVPSDVKNRFNSRRNKTNGAAAELV